MLTARAIEQGLYEQTLRCADFDLTPSLRTLDTPTLVVHGEHDFIPVHVARQIAAAVPQAHLVVLSDCGHFAYLEQPERVRTTIVEFLSSAR